MSIYKNENFITGQIAVYKTDKKLVEFIDQLNPAPLQDYAAIHAGVTRPCINAEGRRVYSNIGIVVQNYGDKQDGKSIRAKANISPEEALYVALNSQGAVMGLLPVFEYKTMKIFGEADNYGYSHVTHLRIVKHPAIDQDGTPRRYAWEISVENGKGRKGHNKQGGTYCISGSYLKEKQVSVFLSELDFYKMTCALQRYITQWENAYAPKLIRDARAIKEAERTAFAETRQGGQ